MTRRTSLALTVADKPEDRRRRRTAGARLEAPTEPLIPPTPAPSGVLGSSPATPLIISSDDETDDTTHCGSRSDKKNSKKIPKSKSKVQPAKPTAQLDKVTTHGATVSEGCASRSVRMERDVSPSPSPREYKSYYDKDHVKRGNTRNHRERYAQCKTEQEKDKKMIGDAQGIPDGDEESETRKTPPSSACELLNGRYARKSDNRNKAKMDRTRKQEVLGNDNTSAQMVSLELRKIANEKLLETEEEGYIYIHRDTESGLLKIGYSNDPKRRGHEHKKCRQGLVNIHISNRIRSMKRAERLVKVDLSHLCRPWPCASCQCTHKEYFEVKEERAKTIVDAWANWINDCEPYNRNGDLLPIWTYLLDFGRVAERTIETHDHEARWAHWQWVLSAPSDDDFARFPRRDAPGKHGRGSEQVAVGQRKDIREKNSAPEPSSPRNRDGLVDSSTLALLEPVKHIVVGRKSRSKYSVTFEFECQMRQSYGRDSVDRLSQQ